MATIRVSSETHHKAQELAKVRGEAMSEVVAAAVEKLWRDQLWASFNEYYAELRRDPEAWQRELDERAAWAAIEHWDEE
jgi:predicted transcriptional regulator